MINFIVCPFCHEQIRISTSTCVCDRGHQFPVIDGIPDLLPQVKDSNVLDEESHWDNVAEKGRLSTTPDKYINKKIHTDYRVEFEKCIKIAWSGTPEECSIADIGCGPGSAIDYLDKIEFQKVNYVGIDVSMKTMRTRTASGEVPPDNWKICFIRASANMAMFKDKSLDIVFSASALHHLNLSFVIEWVSKSLKPNGLLILHEPSAKNPFAKIGRRFVRDFHTKGERAIFPSDVIQLAYKNDLTLIYEKGLHNLVGPLQYLVGMIKPPFPITLCVYYVFRMLDNLITSPSWNYSFVQVYKKIR